MGGVALPLSHAYRLLPLQLCQLGLQRGVGAEPQAPTRWPSGNLPGADKLQSLVRKTMRSPNKNGRSQTQPEQRTSLGRRGEPGRARSGSSGLWADLRPSAANGGEGRAG